MDQNKLEKLREMGYSFQPVCALCMHSSFPINNWGTCNQSLYMHLKHKEFRDLSIHKYGSCSSFDREPKSEIDSFENYIKGV